MRDRQFQLERLPNGTAPRCGRKPKERNRVAAGEAAIDFEAEPDRLRPGEECESPPWNELPGATLPWALTRILHSRRKNRNTGRRPAAAAARGAPLSPKFLGPKS